MCGVVSCFWVDPIGGGGGATRPEAGIIYIYISCILISKAFLGSHAKSMRHETAEPFSLVSADQEPRGAGNASSTRQWYIDLGRSCGLQICHGDELLSVSRLHGLQAYHFPVAELINGILRPVPCTTQLVQRCSHSIFKFFTETGQAPQHAGLNSPILVVADTDENQWLGNHQRLIAEVQSDRP